MKKMNKKGFTLVELVIVIAVIAILAAVLIPTFAGVIERANKSSRLQTAQNSLKMALAEEPDANIPDGSYIIVEKDSKNYKYIYTDGKLGDEAVTTDAADTDPTAGFYSYSKNADAPEVSGASIKNIQIAEMATGVTVFVKNS